MKRRERIETTLLRHYRHRFPASFGHHLDDTTRLVDSESVDIVEEGSVERVVKVVRQVGLVGANGSGHVGCGKLRIEIELVLTHLLL